MGAGPAHALYLERRSPVHRLAPEVKIAATVAYTVAVVLTPREEFVAFGLFALLLVPVAALARVGPWWLAKRSLIEAPFIVFAFILPFLAGGERVEWLGLHLSIDGLLGAWNIFVKGTLGVLASLLLAATTTMRDLIIGLDRLKMPQLMTQIATFMLRYVDVISEDARRMRIARVSRGYDPRFLWQVKAFAVGIGALFVRTYERGERVFLAMLSRGYAGRMPAVTLGRAGVGEWCVASILPLVAGAIAVWAAW